MWGRRGAGGGICGAGSGLWGEVEDGGSHGACGCYSVGLKGGIRAMGGGHLWGGRGLWGWLGGRSGASVGRGGYCVML